MIDLTDRQTQILKSIIEEYIKSADSVGSDTLEKKFNLGICPATIRNEMVKLTKMGFLKQPHISSGRLPTTDALKFYVNHLMEEKELGITDELAVKEKIWDYRHKLDSLFKEITIILAEKTNSLAITVIEKGGVFHSGYANILDMPEFFDIDATKSVLSVIEDFNQLIRFFEKVDTEENIHTLMGEDFEIEDLASCSMVFSDFKIESEKKGFVGVIGPCRLDYSIVVPTVKYFSQLIKDVLGAF